MGNKRMSKQIQITRRLLFPLGILNWTPPSKLNLFPILFHSFQFSRCGPWTPGVSRTFSEDLWCQNYFHNNTDICSYTVLVFVLMVQKHWKGKTAVPLAQAEAATPNCVGSCFTPYHRVLKIKKSFWLKDVLESVTTVKSIKSWPLSTCLFNILWNKMEIIHKVFLLVVKVLWSHWGKWRV